MKLLLKLFIMKRIVGILALGMLLSGSLFGQTETLFGHARVVGGFGAPIIEWGLNNDLSTSVGGGGAIVIDEFFIGGYGIGSIDFEQLLDDGTVDRLELGHGGFWLGYAIGSFNVLHLHLGGRIGWGAVNVDLTDNNIRYSDLDRVFVMTPEAGLELNVTKWFRLSGGIGYRWVQGIDENNIALEQDALDGLVATLGVKFGWFGNRYNRRNRHDRW